MNSVYEFTIGDYDGLIFSSIHATKRGAYKAMNKYLNHVFSTKRNERLLYGTSEHLNIIYDHVFGSSVYGVTEVIILD